MTLAGYKNYRNQDCGGGLNLLSSSTEIKNNQFTILDGFSVQGNQMVTLKGYGERLSVLSDVHPHKGLATFGDRLFGVQFDGTNNKIFCYNTKTQVVETLGTTLPTNSPKYAITAFFLGAIYIVITGLDGLSDLKMYRYDTATSTFHLHTITGLTDAKFTVSSFYQGKLLLGGNPLYPSSLYYSKTGNATTAIATPDAWMDFSGYNGGSQVVGTGQFPITAIKGNNSGFYVCTNKDIWKILSEVDNGTTFAYQLNQVTQAGPVGHYAITQAGQDMVYFDGRSVRRLSYETLPTSGGATTPTLTIQDNSISHEIEPYINMLNKNQSGAVIWYTYPYIKVALRGIDSTDNSTNIVYNVINKCWSTQGQYFIGTATQGYSNKDVAYIGFHNKGEFARDDVEYSLDGADSPLRGTARTKELTFGDNVDYKRFVQVEMNGSISPGLTMEVDIVVDGRVITTRSISKTQILQSTVGSSTIGSSEIGSLGDEPLLREYKERFEIFNDGQSIYLVFRYIGIGKFILQNYAIQWKPVGAFPIHH